MSKPPHILVIPYPAQGHVNPLMDFSRYLAKSGVKITFVNSEYYHKRIVEAMPEDGLVGGRIHLVSIPDGLGPEDDRNEFAELYKSLVRVVPAKLVELIISINQVEGEEGKIKCVLFDGAMGWALETTHKMGIRGAVLWPASAMNFALSMSIPMLINDGIVDDNGIPKRQTFQLSPRALMMDAKTFFWCCLKENAKEKIFKVFRGSAQALHLADWWLCNTTYELEPEAFSLFPKIKPIGPLMASRHTGNAGAQFWKEDSTCLNWLDQQPIRSVIYVAFGSITPMDPVQFEEISHGLQLSNRPFLWVVRPGITNGTVHGYSDGLKGTQGKIVSWAPQQKVLSHPAIAGFLSHCGWNSIIEGLSNGVPFLCWPYFADQLGNQDYICDVWKVGLRFDHDEKGIITRGEIKKKVEQLLGDENLKARSLKLKEMAIKNVSENGRSSKNFNEFHQWLKE